MTEYRDFILKIDKNGGDGYQILVDRPDKEPFTVPLSAAKLNTLDLVDDKQSQQFGKKLFQAIFPAKVEQAFWQAFRYNNKNTEGGLFRVLLDLPEELDSLPWELIYCEHEGLGFLAHSPEICFARYRENETRDQPPFQERTLNVLLIGGKPDPLINMDEEVKAITAPLKEAGGAKEFIRRAVQALAHPYSIWERAVRWRNRQRYTIQPIPKAKKTDIEHRLGDPEQAATDRIHVVHYIGHGEPGALLLQPDWNHKGKISAGEFADIVVQPSPSVRLVVLNACYTAAGTRLIDSTAHVLLERGVPAVIGMQTKVDDRAAVEFSREFYTAWAGGQCIEQAMATARSSWPDTGTARETDWAIPSLYLSTREDLTIHPEGEAPLWLRLPFWIIDRGWKPLLGSAALLALVITLLFTTNVEDQVRLGIEPLRCQHPVEMEENFNIAISPFTVTDETGRVINDPLGMEAASTIFEAAEGQLKDQGIGLRGPAQTCRVSADTAQAVQEKMRADILVYGTIKKQADAPPELSLQFQVGSAGLQESPEIAGPYQMGRAMPFWEKDLKVEDSIIAQRSIIFAQVVHGLYYYSKGQYTRALSYFKQAEGSPGWRMGKELIYLLEGNAYQYQASCGLEAQKIQAAESAYEQALQISPGYLRTRLGQASMLYLQALKDKASLPAGCPSGKLENIDQRKLDAAQASYESILAEALKTPDQSLPILPKVYTGLGNVYYLQYLHSGDPAWLQKARQAYEKTTALGADNPAVNVTVGKAYLMLATEAYCAGRIDEAIAGYTQAALRLPPGYSAISYRILGNTYCWKNDLKNAIQSYKKASASCNVITQGECGDFSSTCAAIDQRRQQIEEQQSCSP